ncbi:MAG TPA: aldo/keto reductase [bacterium]|nr:aldo/keto reductase [bacterium]
MKTRKLGKDGPDLTVIGLGAWAIGGPWIWGWGTQDDQQSIDTIHRAIDLGINWIDTAAVYGLGHSESILGGALRGIRKKVIVATKCGLVWNNKGKVRNDLSPASIRKELEASLQRLQTDYIDLYQFHWPDPNIPVEKSWETMVQLKQEGKIRFIGVSNFDVPLLERCEKIAHVDSLQPQYNMVKRDSEKKILPYCEQVGVGVVAYSPMMSGLLSGKFDLSKIAAGDWRRKSDDFREPKLSKHLALVDELRPIANKYNATVAQLVVAWVLKQHTVTSAIVGARRPDQVVENVKSAELEISDEDWETIENTIQNIS